MKTSNGIIAVLFLWFSTVAALAANPPTPAANSTTPAADLSERMRIQQERLSEIARVAAQAKQQVEQSSQQEQAAAVQELARRTAAGLSLAERSLWVEFAKMHQDQPYPAGYFDAASYGFPFGPEGDFLRYAMVQEYLVSEMADLLQSEAFRTKLQQIVSEGWKIALLRQQARQLLRLMETLKAESKMKVQQLESDKQAKLEATAAWERQLQEQVRTILDYLRQAEARPSQLGVVESVGFSPRSGYYCTIEGIEQVLQPGDSVRGIRVVSVDPEKVQFAKNGLTWTQALGAPPQSQWE